MKWILHHFENDPVFSRQAEIRDGNGYFVCRLDDCPSNAIIQSDIDAGFPPDDYEREVFARNLANARLIAAAPDMLAALRRLVHPMADDTDLDNARDVIARALGEA
jgi:hypothetical protein